MSGFKLLALIFPFIREMVLGDKTLLQAIKTNKLKVLLLMGIMASFFLNITMVPKLIDISNRYVRLHDRYELNDKELTNLKKTVQDKDKLLAHCTPDSALPTPPTTPVNVPPQTDPATLEAGYARLHRTYDQAAPAKRIPSKLKPSKHGRYTSTWQSDFDQIRNQETQYDDNYKHH